MKRTAAVLALAAAMGAATWAQDTRTTVRTLAGKCLDARRAVAHNCSKCEGAGKVHRPVTDARGYRSIEVTCPTCSGAGLVFVQKKADEVKACFWKGSRYPAALWGRGSSGRGVKRDKRPPAAARVIGLAEDAGWLTDTTSVDKVGEIRAANGVQWTEVKLQIGDSTPGSFTYVKFPEGWRIVAPDEIDAAVVAAGGRPGDASQARGEVGDGLPREAQAGGGSGERIAGANERRSPHGSGRRCRAKKRIGDWFVNGGTLGAKDAAGETWLHFADELVDYELTFKFRLDPLGDGAAAGHPALKVRLHVNGDSTWTALNLSYAPKPHLQATQRINGKWSNLKHRIAGIAIGREYAMRFVVRGARVECFMDGTPLMNYEAVGLSRGAIGFIVHNAHAAVSEFKVTAPDGRTLFDGCPQL